MLHEVLAHLEPCLLTEQDSKLCIDATVGIGGHAKHLLTASKNTFLLANDVDADSLTLAQENLADFGERVRFSNLWFDELLQELTTKNTEADAILFDLGVSRFHYTHAQRGFSWKLDETLDMRLNSKESFSAQNILRFYDEDELRKLFYMFGEERQSAKWAKRIVGGRKEGSIETTQDLCAVLQLGKKREDKSILARLFQAIRIEVNSELERLKRSLPLAWDILKPKGRLAVISFHSLEDRIVKQFARYVEGKLKEDDFLPNFNSKYCGTGRSLHKRPLVPDKDEIEENYASRSAKLRIMEKTT